MHSGYTFFFYQYVCSLGIEPRTFCAANAMLYHWATGTCWRYFEDISKYLKIFQIEDISKCWRYFEEPNSCWSPLTSIVGKKILWKSIGTINCLITAFFKISSYMFNIRNKLIQVWNEMRVSKWWQFSFLGEPFKMFLLLICSIITGVYINITMTHSISLVSHISLVWALIIIKLNKECTLLLLNAPSRFDLLLT